MPLDPTVPDPTGQAAWRDLIRRVEVLERANKLLSSTITGGTLRVLDGDTGAAIVLFGEIDPNINGMRAYMANGTSPVFEVDQLNGFSLPWMATNWRVYEDSSVTHSTEGYGEVTGSTFRRLWRATNELLFSGEMLFRMIVTCPAATTGEIRIWHNNTSAVLGDVLEVPASTTAHTYEFRLDHGITIGGGPHNFYVEGRVTSGAGLLKIYEPGGIHWGARMSPVSGGWVP